MDRNSFISADPVLLAPDGCTPYRASSIPLPGRPMLGIWAHPDDESYLSAGLMARTIRAGERVTLVTLTDGEGGFADDDPLTPGARSQLRRRELTEAMKRIGVSDVRLLGLADGGVAREDGDHLVEVLADIIRSERPEVIVTFGPDGITGHDDHIATWRAVTRAWLAVGHGDLRYAVHTTDWLDEWRDVNTELGVWMADEPVGVDPASVALRIDLDRLELINKRAVLAEHASQTGGISALLGEDVYRRWIQCETFRRPTPADLAAALAPAADSQTMATVTS